MKIKVGTFKNTIWTCFLGLSVFSCANSKNENGGSSALTPAGFQRVDGKNYCTQELIDTENRLSETLDHYRSSKLKSELRMASTYCTQLRNMLGNETCLAQDLATKQQVVVSYAKDYAKVCNAIEQKLAR